MDIHRTLGRRDYSHRMASAEHPFPGEPSSQPLSDCIGSAWADADPECRGDMQVMPSMNDRDWSPWQISIPLKTCFCFPQTLRPEDGIHSSKFGCTEDCHNLHRTFDAMFQNGPILDIKALHVPNTSMICNHFFRWTLADAHGVDLVTTCLNTPHRAQYIQIGSSNLLLVQLQISPRRAEEFKHLTFADQTYPILGIRTLHVG